MSLSFNRCSFWKPKIMKDEFRAAVVTAGGQGPARTVEPWSSSRWSQQEAKDLQGL